MDKIGMIFEAFGGLLTAIGMGIGLVCNVKNDLSKSNDSSEKE